MSELWAACVSAGPLETFPRESRNRVIKKVHDFYHTFKYYRRIRRDENANIACFHEYQQTWDECVDALYRNPHVCHLDLTEEATLLHRSSRYVYNVSDLELFEKRLELQLHVLNACIDCTILHLYTRAVNSESRRSSIGAPDEFDYPDDENLPSSRTPVEKNTLRLFLYLKLHRAPTSSRKYPLNSHQNRQLWKLVIARFQAHAVQSPGSSLLFARGFPMSDHNRKALKEYSQQTFTDRERAYRKSKDFLLPNLRRRVFSYNQASSLTFKMGPYEDPDELYSLDVVTRAGTGSWVVGTKMSKQWGVVQYLPMTTDFRIYTNHDIFRAPEVRLDEPCKVDYVCHGMADSHKDQYPTYRFSDISASTAFQSAIRGKFLQRIFQIKTISFAKGPFSNTAQQLKLWSDFDGKNRVLSFMAHEKREEHSHYIEVPLRRLSNKVRVKESENQILVDFAPHDKPNKASPPVGQFKRKISELGSKLKLSSSNNDVPVTVPDNFSSTVESGEDDSASEDSQYLYAFGCLKLQFSTSNDATHFEETLSNYFGRRHRTESNVGDEDFDTSGEEDPYLSTSGSGNIEPTVCNVIRNPPSRPPTPPSSIGNSRPGSEVTTEPSIDPGKHVPTAAPKDLDYRVKGIKLDCDSNELPLFLRRKLKLSDDIKIRVKSLAVNHNGSFKVAVVALRPRPEQFSSPVPGEWIIDDDEDSSDPDRARLTVDIHFRGVTVLYAPKDCHYNIDICAVAGLGGHAWGSFKHKAGPSGQAHMPEGSFMWILDALRLQFPTARLMTYGSKTKLDGSQSSQTLRELGAQLRSELRTVRQQPRAASVISLPQTRPPNYKYIPSIFIAHSLGGLSVKEALLQESKDPEHGSFLENLHGAIFFGVPNHGMKTRVLEAMVRGQPNEPLVQSIQYESQTLRQLSTDFKVANFKYGKPKIAYFYEMEPSFAPQFVNGQWRMTGEPKKVLVKKDSATDGFIWEGGNVTTQGLNRDHSDLVKFSSLVDADLEQVIEELKKLVDYSSWRAEEAIIASDGFD